MFFNSFIFLYLKNIKGVNFFPFPFIANNNDILCLSLPNVLIVISFVPFILTIIFSGDSTKIAVSSQLTKRTSLS